MGWLVNNLILPGWPPSGLVGSRTPSPSPLVIAAALIFSSSYVFAGDTVLKPVTRPQHDQQVIYSHGEPVLLSKGIDADLALTAVVRPKDIFVAEIFVHVGIMNKSGQLLNIDPMALSIEAHHRNARIDKLKTIEPDKILAARKFDQGMTDVANALNVIAGAINDSQQATIQSTTVTNSYGTYGGPSRYSGYVGNSYENVWGNHSGFYQGSSISTTNVYDQRYVDSKIQKRTEDMEKEMESGQQKISELDQGLLKRHTIPVGSWIEGDIVTSHIWADKYIVTINVGHDQHIIEFHKP